MWIIHVIFLFFWSKWWSHQMSVSNVLWYLPRNFIMKYLVIQTLKWQILFFDLSKTVTPDWDVYCIVCVPMTTIYLNLMYVHHDMSLTSVQLWETLKSKHNSWRIFTLHWNFHHPHVKISTNCVSYLFPLICLNFKVSCVFVL